MLCGSLVPKIFCLSDIDWRRKISFSTSVAETQNVLGIRLLYIYFKNLIIWYVAINYYDGNFSKAILIYDFWNEIQICFLKWHLFVCLFMRKGFVCSGMGEGRFFHLLLLREFTEWKVSVWFSVSKFKSYWKLKFWYVQAWLAFHVYKRIKVSTWYHVKMWKLFFAFYATWDREIVWTLIVFGELWFKLMSWTKFDSFIKMNSMKVIPKIGTSNHVIVIAISNIFCEW